jgi:hypothetical protein
MFILLTSHVLDVCNENMARAWVHERSRDACIIAAEMYVVPTKCVPVQYAYVRTTRFNFNSTLAVHRRPLYAK